MRRAETWKEDILAQMYPTLKREALAALVANGRNEYITRLLRRPSAAQRRADALVPLYDGPRYLDLDGDSAPKMEAGPRGAWGDEGLDTPHGRMIMPTPKRPKALRLTRRNMTALQQERDLALQRKDALWKTNQILADEIADVKAKNAALYADNVAYKTKIAEWELGAGIGVEEVWRRLNRTLLEQATQAVAALKRQRRRTR